MKKRKTCSFGHIVDDLAETLTSPDLEPIEKEAQLITFLVLGAIATILLISTILGTGLVSLRFLLL